MNDTEIRGIAETVRLFTPGEMDTFVSALDGDTAAALGETIKLAATAIENMTGWTTTGHGWVREFQSDRHADLIRPKGGS